MSPYLLPIDVHFVWDFFFHLNLSRIPCMTLILFALFHCYTTDPRPSWPMDIFRIPEFLLAEPVRLVLCTSVVIQDHHTIRHNIYFLPLFYSCLLYLVIHCLVY
jgi:hypothetical protein